MFSFYYEKGNIRVYYDRMPQMEPDSAKILHAAGLENVRTAKKTFM